MARFDILIVWEDVAGYVVRGSGDYGGSRIDCMRRAKDMIDFTRCVCDKLGASRIKI